MNTIKAIVAATDDQIRSAITAAYAAGGVKVFTEVGRGFISDVQHNASRAKNIAKDAAGRLERKGLSHTIRIDHAARGRSMHMITY